MRNCSDTKIYSTQPLYSFFRTMTLIELGVNGFFLSMIQDENGSSLTDEEIVGEVVTFMFAGHDTTASGVYNKISFQTKTLVKNLRQPSTFCP